MAGLYPLWLRLLKLPSGAIEWLASGFGVYCFERLILMKRAAGESKAIVFQCTN